jgi:hypothetical protein
MNREEQEVDLTRWANGVAEELDRKHRPELAAVFRGLARRDADAVRQAVAVYTPAMLRALEEMVKLEQSDRAEAGQERAVEILGWLERLIEKVEEEGLTVDLPPDGEETVQ